MSHGSSPFLSDTSDSAPFRSRWQFPFRSGPGGTTPFRSVPVAVPRSGPVAGRCARGSSLDAARRGRRLAGAARRAAPAPAAPPPPPRKAPNGSAASGPTLVIGRNCGPMMNRRASDRPPPAEHSASLSERLIFIRAADRATSRAAEAERRRIPGPRGFRGLGGYIEFKKF